MPFSENGMANVTRNIITYKSKLLLLRMYNSFILSLVLLLTRADYSTLNSQKPYQMIKKLASCAEKESILTFTEFVEL